MPPKDEQEQKRYRVVVEEYGTTYHDTAEQARRRVEFVLNNLGKPAEEITVLRRVPFNIATQVTVEPFHE